MTQVRFDLKPSQPVEYGYFAVNVSGRIAGTASAKDASVELTGISKGGGRTATQVTISKEVAEDWKVSLKSKLENKNVDEIVAAFRDGHGNIVQRLAAAFGKTLATEISHKDKIGPAEIDVGGGVELTQTPFYF